MSQNSRIHKESHPQPQIISRPEHTISRKNIDREALKVLYRLKDFGHIAYLVGGSVRDLLLGKEPKDFDVGTDARPEEIKKIFKYSRIIGKRFKIVHVYFRGGKYIEVATFRPKAEWDAENQAFERENEVNIYGAPQEDAFRRDLTINGLFYNIADFSVIDYVGGIQDLKNGIIRAIGDPDVRFARDPVRMLRAIRHSARTGFEIEPATWLAITKHKEKIYECSIHRVRDEWLKDLRSGSSKWWAEKMIASGLFQILFPYYVSSLEGRDGHKVKDLLLGLLSRLDKLINTDGVINDALIIAFFLYPWLHFLPEWKGLSSVRIRWPIGDVRHLMDHVMFQYDFPKALREGASQILAGLLALDACAHQGSWPKRVWNKPVFNDTLCLYNYIREIQGEERLEPSFHLRGHRARKPKTRRRRRKKSEA